MNWDDDDIPRMKRDRHLPTVLTKAEISAILDATPNLKHNAKLLYKQKDNQDENAGYVKHALDF